MSLALGPRLRRVLDHLDAADSTLPLAELTQRLLALRAPVGEPLARRLLGAALGCPPERLPGRIAVRALPRLLEGPAADLPLEAAVFVVVDLETTGLSAERCGILEIGAVRIARLQPVDRFQTLVDPGDAIPRRITALTGIDRAAVDGAPGIDAAIRRFADWVGHGSAVFVAHNAAFDARFTARAYADAGLPGWPGPVLCTRRLARRVLPDLGRFDLDTLCARFGISNRSRHRALGDAEATARALLDLVDLARRGHAAARVGDLLVLQRAPRRRPRRPAGRAGTAAVR